MLTKRSSTILFRSGASKAGTRLSGERLKKLRSLENTVTDPIRVGIWDIDAYAGFLFRVLERLNKNQRLFEFSRIEATVPMGLTLSGERTRQIVRRHHGKYKDPDIANNVLADDIFKVAKPVKATLDIDVLTCVVAPMIMAYLKKSEGDSENGIGWNFFSVSRKELIIVSAYDLRAYAKKARRPFEAAMSVLVFAAVLAAVFPDVGFHDETRACIMDYCDNRDDIVKMLRKLVLCKESWQEIPEHAHDSVRKILDTIREYPG
jgi:hypothetical protein